MRSTPCASETFQDWQLLLVDDHSTEPHVRDPRGGPADPLITVRYRPENGGIVAASNDALAMATGDVLAFLDHDDRLRATALEKVVAAFDQTPARTTCPPTRTSSTISGCGTPVPQARLVSHPVRCQMYTCHLSAFRRSIVDKSASCVTGSRAPRTTTSSCG